MTPASEPCPICGARGVDVTTARHTGPRAYICTGPVCHEFFEGDTTPELEPDEPDIVEQIADRVVERMHDRPSLMKRLTRLF